jgi:hypothetical protein
MSMAYPRWEYCIIKYGPDRLGNAVFVYFSDGNVLRFRGNEPELARVFSQLGGEGWETSGGGGGGATQGSHIFWVLRRPA